jgi:hypothetical protein
MPQYTPPNKNKKKNRNEGQVKTFSDIGELREFAAKRSVLKEVL